MNVLIISPTSKGIGGVSRHVQELTSYLTKNNFNVEIMSSENTKIINVRMLKNPSFMISSWMKAKKSKTYDIIIAENLPSALAMSVSKGKKILSLHGIHHRQVSILHGKILGRFAKSYESKALNWADHITVSSKEQLDYYDKLKPDIKYLPNGIDINGLPKNVDKRYEKQITYVGRMSKEKGVLDILNMAAGLPSDIHVLLVGSGPESFTIKNICRALSNVHYLGYQNKEDTISLIRGSDIILQPSIMEGGLSYVRLEAMACRVPLICTNVGDSVGILNHLQNAYLIRPNQPQEMLKATFELINNEYNRKVLAENAFETVKQFDWGIVGKEYLKFYCSIVEMDSLKRSI